LDINSYAQRSFQISIVSQKSDISKDDRLGLKKMYYRIRMKSNVDNEGSLWNF